MVLWPRSNCIIYKMVDNTRSLFLAENEAGGFIIALMTPPIDGRVPTKKFAEWPWRARPDDTRFYKRKTENLIVSLSIDDIHGSRCNLPTPWFSGV